MDRINTSNKAADLFGAGKHGFKGGNPATGEKATYFSPDWANQVQEEIAGVIEAAGLELDPADLTQMVDALAILVPQFAGLSGYLRKTTSAILEAGYWTTPVPLAINAGVATPDLTEGNVFAPSAPLAADLTLAVPADLAGRAGMYLVVLTQDATGGRALTLAAGHHLAGGEWSTTANAVNILWITSDGSGLLDVVIAQRGA